MIRGRLRRHDTTPDAAPRQPADADGPGQECPDDHTIHLLTSGHLGGQEQERVWAHVAQCDRCCELLVGLGNGSVNLCEGSAHPTFNPNPSEPLVLEPGTTLGRYVLTRALGAGGMGVVWEARDLELDRSVALKFLRPAGEQQDANVRLLREAQAMARLSHPNVIAVHDAGIIGGQAFIAMEQVHGFGLDRWLTQQTRSVADVVKVFLDAGHGLAAAHGVGLVHRDFKPQNVLMDPAGRAKVTDFGLARVLRSPEQPAPDPQPAQDTATGLSTRAGWLVGTLQYMSPEQIQGKEATPASDQFSFCVSLWEALHGQRPFGGKTPEEMHRSIQQGPPAARQNRVVPISVHRALVKGLSSDPASRHSSMEALLSQLAPRHGLQRGSMIVVVGALVAVAASLPGYRYLLDQPEPCGGAHVQLQEVWGEEPAQEIGRAFLATGSPHAQHVFTGVRQRLDAYAAAWVAMHTEACRATRVHGHQPESLLLARMDCLEGRKQELDALVDVLRQVDARAVDHAIQAVESLRGLEHCANAKVLVNRIPLPEDLAVRQQIEGARGQLAKARALCNAGRYREALALTQGLEQAVAALAFLPLEGEWLAQHGDNLSRNNQLDKAMEVLRKAAVIHEVSHEDEAAAWVYAEMILVSIKQAKFELLGLFADQLESCNGRLGTQADITAVWEEALAHYLYRWKSNLPGALVHAQRAVELMNLAMGPGNARVVNARGLLGAILGSLHRAGDEIEQQRAVVDINIRALGPTHPNVATSLNNLGWALMKAGRYEESRDTLQRAQRLRASTLGPEHASTLWNTVGMAEALGHMGRHQEALTLLEGVLPRMEKAAGSKHPRVGYVHFAMGKVLVGMGQARKALLHVEGAVALWERADPEHLDVAEALVVLGDTLQAMNQPGKGLKAYERAATIFSAKHHPKELALANLGIAETLTALGVEPDRARELASGAREELVTANPILKPYLLRAERWLAAHARNNPPAPTR